MTNVKKFFSNDFNDENQVDFVQSAENEAIEIKLIKQKSQGLISGYHYNFYRNIWTIKGVNGVDCECQLNKDAECFGNVRFSYKGQIIRKYFNNECLANAIGESYDELSKLYQEELEEIKAKELQNELDMSMDILAVA